MSTTGMVAHRGEVIAKSVGFEYDTNTVLDDTCLHVKAGEFFTLLGSSGSGKTTLLRIIAGLLEPNRGEVQIDGEDVTSVPTQRRDIGFVFQNYALFPHMNVSQNIEFGLKTKKYPSEDRKVRIQDMLDLVSLVEMSDRMPSQLSGGQQQRVALGRALAQGPRVLLLDEPLGALDRGLRQELGFEIRRIQQESRTTAIYVTHDQEEAFILSDRIGVMRDGVITQIGTPEDVYRNPRNVFVAKFLGKTNLIPGEVVQSNREITRVDLGGHVIDARTPAFDLEKAVYCSIRPEQLTLEEKSSGEDYESVCEATVTESRFLGQRHAVKMNSAFGDISADLDSRGKVPEVGDHVTLFVRPVDVALVNKNNDK